MTVPFLKMRTFCIRKNLSIFPSKQTGLFLGKLTKLNKVLPFLYYTFALYAVDRTVNIRSQASFGFYWSWNRRTLPLFRFLCNFKPNKEPQETFLIRQFLLNSRQWQWMERVLFFRQINIHCAPSLLLRYFITTNVFIGQWFVCLVT